MKFVKTFELFGYEITSKKKHSVENIFKQYIFELKDRGYDFTKPTGKLPSSYRIYTDAFRHLSMNLRSDGFWIDVKLEPNYSKGKCEVLMRKIIQDEQRRRQDKTENLPVVNINIDNNFVDSLISLLEQQLQ
jgi:hypothetical protein